MHFPGVPGKAKQIAGRRYNWGTQETVRSQESLAVPWSNAYCLSLIVMTTVPRDWASSHAS